jgi:hypothetical protein
MMPFATVTAKPAAWPISLYVLSVLAVAIGLWFIPQLKKWPRPLLSAGLLLFFLGPAWDSYFKTTWHGSRQLIRIPGLPTAEETKLVAKRQADTARVVEQLHSYAKSFLTPRAYIAYVGDKVLAPTGTEVQIPSEWERFDKGLADKDPTLGRWTHQRVFGIAHANAQYVAGLVGYKGTHFHVPDNAAYAGVRRDLDREQMGNLFSFLQLLDPQNTTHYAEFMEGAMQRAAENEANGRSSHEGEAALDSLAKGGPVTAQVEVATPAAKPVLDASQMTVTLLRAGSSANLYEVTTPDGTSHRVMAANPEAAKAFLANNP